MSLPKKRKNRYKEIDMAAFDDKVAFVSAGATGIGLSTAQYLVDRGARVMICARRETTLQDAVKQLGANADYVVCDVSDEASVVAAIDKTVEQFGALHCAVNCAGTGTAGPFVDMDSGQFDEVMKTNLYGTFYATRAQARVMMASGGGSIVNIGSLAGTVTHRWLSAYCASKAGLSMLSKCAADELGEHNVRVNVVEPGGVETPLAEMLFATESGRREYLDNMPVSRLGRTEDIAAMVAFLLSDEAAWITGEVIGVDGGHHLRRGPNVEKCFEM
jgi:NAD(P)-dependent dehydrogenase (short-subunit alcohol dehydrogenase family)